jgi:hypothetical protein
LDVKIHLDLEVGRFAQQRVGGYGLTLGEQVNVQRKERADLLAAIALPELQLLAQGGCALICWRRLRVVRQCDEFRSVIWKTGWHWVDLANDLPGSKRSY